MIHVIVGTDVGARSDRRKERLGDARAEELRWEDMHIPEFKALASTDSFLSESRAYVLTGSLTDTQRGDEFLSALEDAARSSHIFVFEEEKILKKQRDFLDKLDITVDATASTRKTEPFNVFTLANSLASRDRKRFWLLLMKATRAGIAPENIMGVLHWKVRDMLGKPGASLYSKGELKTMSRELIVMYHDSHRGRGDLGLLLERFALGLTE